MARILYFGALPDLLDTASEESELPDSVSDVESFLSWLRRRGGIWEQVMNGDSVQVTVNREFARPDSALGNKDEIAVISLSLLR